MPYPAIHTRAPETLDDFTNNMHYRTPTDARIPVYQENRERVIDLATYVYETLPQVPERTLVRRHLEDALMRMNQIVAVHDVGHNQQ